MNETLKTLLNRRSIRSYREEQITDGELDTILKAGEYAPNGMSRQAWHFTAVQNKDILNKINDFIMAPFLKSDNSKKRSIFYSAPTLIIVSMNKNKAATPYFDCATALENMFIAAQSLNIGSCWINSISNSLNSENAKSIIKDLQIPDGYTIFGAAAFGYKGTKSPQPVARKENIINIIK